MQYEGKNGYAQMFKELLNICSAKKEYLFSVIIKSVDNNCIVKFYKRDSSSGKMIVFTYSGIVIVEGSLSALYIRRIAASDVIAQKEDFTSVVE